MLQAPGAGVASCALLLGISVPLGRSMPGPRAPQASAAQVQFTDVAQKAGLNVRVVNGGERTKKYIFESTGSGIAFVDYDRDGYPDIFVVNGSRLEGFPAGASPSNRLFHNNRNGTFTDVPRPRA